jgi:serine O-acetyltransferase
MARDFVTRIGFQMLVAYRFMRFCHEGRIPLAPRVASRAIRHLYGSDVHWEADLEPGIVLVHGMGLAISKAARVQHGAILFQHVTLGLGTDPVTREVGAPVIGRDVVVGAGCTLIGPISVGQGSKVTANCLVRASVPPQSLVEAASPVVTPRRARGGTSSSEAES